MTQTPEVGLPTVDADGQSHDQGNPISRVVLVVLLVGLASLILTWWWFDSHSPTPGLIGPDQPLLVVALLVIAVISELVFFPVRHDDGFEELTYFEFVMVGALLLYEPTVALPVLVAGTALAELSLDALRSSGCSTSARMR